MNQLEAKPISETRDMGTSMMQQNLGNVALPMDPKETMFRALQLETQELHNLKSKIRSDGFLNEVRKIIVEKGPSIIISQAINIYVDMNCQKFGIIMYKRYMNKSFE